MPRRFRRGRNQDRILFCMAVEYLPRMAAFLVETGGLWIRGALNDIYFKDR
jgi:hypothetical protein